MKVTVVCFGGMRRYLPPEATGNQVLIDIPAPADVSTAVAILGAPAQWVFAVTVDGEQASFETSLHDGAEVVLMPPFSGGATLVAVVTVSDGVAAHTREDDSGDAVLALLQNRGYDVQERVVIADDVDAIEQELRRLVREEINLVCTTGGTGLGPRDVTPEATRRVIDKEAPGIAELMRQEGLSQTKHAALSRGVAGAAGRTLIINLPGSPRGAATSLQALTDILDHAIDLVSGNTAHYRENA